MADIQVNLQVNDSGLAKLTNETIEFAKQLEKADVQKSRTFDFKNDAETAINELRNIKNNIANTFSSLQDGNLKEGISGIAAAFGTSLNPALGIALDLAQGFGNALFEKLSPEQQEKIRQSFEGLFKPLTDVKDQIIEFSSSVLSDLAESFTGVVDPVGAANEAFETQLQRVVDLESTLPAMISRYEDLTGKTKLTKEEQSELNELTKELASIAPNAVIGIDSITGAYKFNLEALKNLTVQEKEFLKQKAEISLELNKVERDRLERTLRVNAEELRTSSGLRQSTIESALRGVPVFVQTDVRNEREKILKETNEVNERLSVLKTQIDKEQKVLDGVTNKTALGSIAAVKSESKALEENTKEKEKNIKATKDNKDAREKELENLQKQLEQSLSKSKIDTATSAEEQIRLQREAELKKTDSLEKKLKEVYDALKKEYDLEGEFLELRQNINTEYDNKLVELKRRTNQKLFDYDTEFDELRKKRIDGGNRGDKATKGLKDNELSLAERIDREGDKEQSARDRQLKREIDYIKNANDARAAASLAGLDPLQRIMKKVQQALGLDNDQFSQALKSFSVLQSSVLKIFSNNNQKLEIENEKLIARLDKQIDTQRKAYEDALKRQEDGLSNNVASEKIALDTLLAQREEAEKKNQELKAKALKVQQAQEAASQLSSLVTAGAGIFKDGVSKAGIVGVIFAAAAIASMVALFSSFKNDVSKATKLRGGGRLKGEKHERGGIDIGLGYEAEDGEWVINSRASQKHDNFLKNVNSGRYDNVDLERAVSAFEGRANSLQSASIKAQQIERFNYNSMKSVFTEVIKEQTGALIGFEEQRGQYIPTTEGYIQIKHFMNGSKQVQKVRTS
jgi:hypothetical protein